MGTKVDQRRPTDAPPGLNPLGKLGWQIQVNKYKPTARETEVLSKCFEDAKWYYLNGALLSGAITWNVTGMGRKVKFIPRIFMTGVMAMIGRDLGGRISGYSCTKKILSLEGSPLRTELMSILQEDYPDHSLLKTDLGQPKSESPYSKTGREPEDYAQEAHAPVSSKDQALEIGDSRTKSRDWPEMLGRDGNGQERSRRIPRIWEIAERKESLRKDDGPDILADPFDIMMQTGVTVEDVSDTEETEKESVERRRSRMGAKERREYDRRRYEQRHEHY